MIRRTNKTSQLSRSFRTQARIASGSALVAIALIAAALLATIAQPPANATRRGSNSNAGAGNIPRLSGADRSDDRRQSRGLAVAGWPRPEHRHCL